MPDDDPQPEDIRNPKPPRPPRGIFDSWPIAFAAAGLWLFVAVIGVLSKNGAQAQWLVMLNFVVPVPLALLGLWGFVVARRHDRAEKDAG
ncbi:hypothetical protein BH09ACT1_BH09ACT1_22150 [soil metagenome]